MSNLLEAIVDHSDNASQTADKMLSAISQGDSDSARDFAIQAVREARPALSLINILQIIHGTEE